MKLVVRFLTAVVGIVLLTLNESAYTANKTVITEAAATNAELISVNNHFNYPNITLHGEKCILQENMQGDGSVLGEQQSNLPEKSSLESINSGVDKVSINKSSLVKSSLVKSSLVKSSITKSSITKSFKTHSDIKVFQIKSDASGSSRNGSDGNHESIISKSKLRPKPSPIDYDFSSCIRFGVTGQSSDDFIVMVLRRINTSSDDYVDDEIVNADLELIVAGLDAKAHQYSIKARYDSVDTLSSNAVYITDVVLDEVTAKLISSNSTQPVVAVRISRKGSSAPNPYSETTLNLFALERLSGKNYSIQNVLDEYIIEQFYGEWDTLCNGEFSEIQRSLSVLPQSRRSTSSNTIFTDILVETKKSMRTMYLANQAVQGTDVLDLGDIDAHADTAANPAADSKLLFNGKAYIHASPNNQ